MKFSNFFLFILIVIMAIFVGSCEEESVVDTTPPVIVLTAPEDGSEIDTVTVVSVTATDNDAVAKVEFFMDNISIGFVTEAPYTDTLDIADYADGKIHTIFAKAEDNSGNTANSKTVSVTFFLRGSKLLMPLNNGTIDSTNQIELKWLPSDGSGDYSVMVSSSNDEFFSNIKYSLETLITEADTIMSVVTIPLEKGEYFWQVQRVNCDACSWSARWSFEISGPDSPNLLEPISTEDEIKYVTETNTPVFKWTEIASAEKYKLQISETNISDGDDIDGDGDINEFEEPISEFETDSTTLVGEPFGPGTFYWKVKAMNKDNVWGDWTYFSYFVISGPFPPVFIEPSDHVIVDVRTPKFSWIQLNNAVEYEIEATCYDDGLKYSKVTSDTSLILEDTLSQGNYVLRIRAKNENDVFGNWSEGQHFRIITTIVDTLENGFNWVTILAGNYTYGENDDIMANSNDFDIMKYEVTNAQFVTYLNNAYENSEITVFFGENARIFGSYSGDEYWSFGDYLFMDLGSEEGRIYFDAGEFMVEDEWESHPVTQVTWFGAHAFADYYSYRLPTEEEWENAARGMTGYDYPFHDEIYNGNANYFGAVTTSTGYYSGSNDTFDSPSIYGAYDMAGNVSEWTHSFWNDVSPHRVRRGGSFMNTADFVRTWVREWSNPDGSSKHIGFRCAK